MAFSKFLLVVVDASQAPEMRIFQVRKSFDDHQAGEPELKEIVSEKVRKKAQDFPLFMKFVRFNFLDKFPNEQQILGPNVRTSSRSIRFEKKL